MRVRRERFVACAASVKVKVVRLFEMLAIDVRDLEEQKRQFLVYIYPLHLRRILYREAGMAVYQVQTRSGVREVQPIKPTKPTKKTNEGQYFILPKY
jgi:hypothetical protein